MSESARRRNLGRERDRRRVVLLEVGQRIVVMNERVLSRVFLVHVMVVSCSDLRRMVC